LLQFVVTCFKLSNP